MKTVFKFLVSVVISLIILSCKKEGNNPQLNQDKYIKNMVFSGDKKRINFYSIKTRKVIDKNCTSFVYFEKNEFQNFDTLIFKKKEIYYGGKKLLKIDSMSINFKNKKIIINKLLSPNLYTPQYLIFYVSKDIGLISTKSDYYNVHIFYDIENNYDLNNEIVKYDFLKHDLEMK